ncbi:MAG: helix-turn-helix domain-containing protein [Sphingomonas bacterium]
MAYTRSPARRDDAALPNSAARHALLEAFAKLALSRRYRDFGVEAVIRSANVARSTFYYHFSGKDELLLQNLQPFIAALADMPFTAQPSNELQHWVAHIWQQRHAACRLLDGTTGRKIEAALVDRLNESFAARRLPDDHRRPLLAHQIAGASLSLLKAWVNHLVTATAPDIACNLWQSAISIGSDQFGDTILIRHAELQSTI